VDGAAGAFGGVQGCRAAGAAPGGRGVTEPEPQAQAGLGRPGDDRRPGAAAPQTAAEESAGDPGHAAALASAAGALAVDLSSSRWPADGRFAGPRHLHAVLNEYVVHLQPASSAPSPASATTRLRRHHHGRDNRYDDGEHTAAEGLGRSDQRVPAAGMTATSRQ
jgi:hypothetical protein